MSSQNIYTLDLDFRGIPCTIASYLIPHSKGVLLIECGPGSTLEALESGLKRYSYSTADVTDVFVTHIHLDHAGAAGWLAQQGATIHVHPVGAPHLLDPEKLLSSAKRIYGDLMDELWGEFLPVPSDRLSILEDEQTITIGGVQVTPLDTPGHARHHFVYFCEGICFSGDIGAVRLSNAPHLRLPMPPPEFHLEDWRASLIRLQRAYEQGLFTRIAPTHFGIYGDADLHLRALEQALDDVAEFIESVMPTNPTIEELNARFLEWTAGQSRKYGINEAEIQAIETANPSWMSPYGIQRYWRKFRTAE